MTEQFTLEKRIDPRGTIQYNQLSRGCRSQSMQRLRHQFFPGAGRPGDQDGSEVRSNAADTRKQFPHGRTVAYHAPAWRQFLLESQRGLAVAHLIDHGLGAAGHNLLRCLFSKRWRSEDPT